MTKLYFSHSAINTYKDCPRKYKLHYIDRIRPVWAPSYFIFGSALDSAAEYLLENFDNFDQGKYYQTFKDALTKYSINGEEIDTSDSMLVRYSKSDCQIELLTDLQVQKITNRGSKLYDNFTIKQFINDYYALKKQQRADKKAKKDAVPIDKDMQLLYNYISYNCLLRKGVEFILPTFEKWAFENVKEVHGVQFKIKITNEYGDSFIGYGDFEVTLNSGKRVVFDFKTTSNLEQQYHAKSADESVQLGIYSQERDNPNVAYIAFDKNIRKRTPRLRWKVVEGTITEDHLDNVFEEIQDVMTQLKDDTEFKKAEDKSICYNFAGCKYYNYCHNKNCMDGLIKLEKKNEQQKS